MANYVTGYINGMWKLTLSTHAKERAVERLKELGVLFDDDKKYVELATAGVTQAMSNKFMSRYIVNAMQHSRRDTDVLVYDRVNKMVYAVVLHTSSESITVKTLAPLHNGTRWEYFNKDFQRICWIHKDAFVFSTPNGNITWTE